MKHTADKTDFVTLDIPRLDHDLKLYVHGEEDRYVSRELREHGIWEPYETSLLMDILRPGDVFVDVGANIGYFSVVAAQLVGVEGRVFAFEPDPDNFALLEASCAANGLLEQVEAVEAGLSTSDSRALLYLSEDNMGDHQIFLGESDRHSLPVTLLKGSDYLRSRLNRLNLLKVDTQGSEYAVMAGLLPYLRELPEPLRIILELTPYSLREAGASGRQLIELLSTLGLDFWIIDHIEHRLVEVEALELAKWCDNVDSVTGDQGFMNIMIGPSLAQ